MASGGSQQHASLNLMACVRESSPQHEEVDAQLSRHDPSNKKRRFHPFRGLRRIFRKKARHQQTESPDLGDPDQSMLESGTPIQVLDAHRSRSTSTLLSGDESYPRKRSSNGMYPSVSHDSVFTAEHQSPHSSSEDLDTAQSSSSLSIQQLVLPGIRAELYSALRRRGLRGDTTSEDDEDLGLPHSPCNSPTTADVLQEKEIKENPTKSHSTCSDGSLLSMDSSEMDDDSSGQQAIGLKFPLEERKTSHDDEMELDVGVTAAPLSHSAARHKMAVRPKRTHGIPRRRRLQQLASSSPLPSTPELNEEASACSASPDMSNQDYVMEEFNKPIGFTRDITADESAVWPTDDVSKGFSNLSLAEVQLKSSSLPPGLTLSPEANSADPLISKVKRHNSILTQRENESTSRITHNFQSSISEHDFSYTRSSYQQIKTSKSSGAEIDDSEEKKEKDFGDLHLRKEYDKDDKKKDESFFIRLIRRSGKKKKEVPHDVESVSSNNSYSTKSVPDLPVAPKRIDTKGRYANEPVKVYASDASSTQHFTQSKHFAGKVSGSKSTPAARQRVQPINIPASPESNRKAKEEKKASDIPFPRNISPPPVEISTRKVHEKTSMTRMEIQHTSSPPKPTWPESCAYYNSKLSGYPLGAWNNNSYSANTPSWEDSLESGITNNAIRNQNQGSSISDHFWPKSRISGLPSYELREKQMDLRYDEREYTSLIGTLEESAEVSAARQYAVKKSKSFRREVDLPHLFPSDVHSDKSPHDIPFCKQSRTVNNSSDYTSLSKFNPTFESSGDEKEVNATETAADGSGRLFSKSTTRTSRTVVKNMSSKTENYSKDKIPKTQYPEYIMKKSASLDSISSFSDTKKSPSPDLQMSYKKSSSNESISSYTQKIKISAYDKDFITIQDSKKEKGKEEPNMIDSRPLSVNHFAEDQSDDAKSLNSVSLSSKFSLESSKPAVDYAAKVAEQNLDSVSQSSDGRLSQISVENGEHSQLSLSQRIPRISQSSTTSEQVPEFLKVQLNRVDNKPATTSTVFDSTERSYSPIKTPDSRQVAFKKRESLSKSVEQSEVSKGDPTLTTPVVRERKSSREDTVSSGNVVYVSQADSSIHKFTDSCPSVTANLDSEKTSVLSDKVMPAKSITSQKQRSKSFPACTAINLSTQKSSVISVMAAITSTPVPLKPVLKKQAVSLDSAETTTKIVKKQTSQDYDEAVLEQSVKKPFNVCTPNLESSVVLRRKSFMKEKDASREEENKTSENVFRFKKVISAGDLGVKKETEVFEKALLPNESSGNQEGSESSSTEEKENEKAIPAGESNKSHDSNLSGTNDVVRRKPLSRSVTGKDDEPELLKVFARRSLKLKDSELETLGQIGAKSQNESSSEQGTKSRDSDKENEDNESPREERKKQTIKEPLGESKILKEPSESSLILKSTTPGIVFANTPRNGAIVTTSNKYQRSLTSNITLTSEQSKNSEPSSVYRKENPSNSPDKRLRNKTVPEAPKKDSASEKTPYKPWSNIYKDKDVDITNVQPKRSSLPITSESKRSSKDSVELQGEVEDSDSVPQFKRIQQRKEEWEQRAQLALKKTIP